MKHGGYFIITVEIFEGKKHRGFAHPHSFVRDDVYSLVKNKFELILEKQSPMMAIDTIKINNKGKLTLVESLDRTKELILLLKKREPLQVHSCRKGVVPDV